MLSLWKTGGGGSNRTELEDDAAQGDVTTQDWLGARCNSATN